MSANFVRTRPSFGPTPAAIARIWPNPGQLWPTSEHVWRRRPSLAKVGQDLAQSSAAIAQLWSSPGQTLGGIENTFSANAPGWPKSANKWPGFGRDGRIWPNPGPTSVALAHTYFRDRPILAQIGPTSVESAQIQEDFAQERVAQLQSIASVIAELSMLSVVGSASSWSAPRGNKIALSFELWRDTPARLGAIGTTNYARRTRMPDVPFRPPSPSA